MTISTHAQLRSASRQLVTFSGGTATQVAYLPYSLFGTMNLNGSLIGNIASGANTTSGVVPIAGDPGFPPIIDTGFPTYITQIDAMSGTTISTRCIYDCLWRGGTYSFNSNITLSSQPSYATRSTAFNTQLWFECVTSTTGPISVQISYDNQDGITKSTGVINLGAVLLKRLIQIPLAVGDYGISKINSIVATVATAGTFNLLILKPLARAGYTQPGYGQPMTNLLIPIHPQTAFYPMSITSSSNAAAPYMQIELSSG